jgi:hypothetical protein
MTRVNVGDGSWQLFVKDAPVPGQITFDLSQFDEAEPFSGIRCPCCRWRPLASSRWNCACVGGPEPHFDGCGTTWNTFATRGRCPGCHHQWYWTSCLRCAQWSRHQDWYEDDEAGGGSA